MTDSNSPGAGSTGLHEFALAIASSTAEALARLSGQRLQAGSLELGATGRAELLAAYSTVAVIAARLRGLTDAGEEHEVRLVMPGRDATTICSSMMMKPESIIAELRDADVVDDQVRHLLQELANVACSSLIGRLRRQFELRVDLLTTDQGFVVDGASATALLPDLPFAGVTFAVTIGAWPDSSWHLLLPPDLATAWGGTQAEVAAPPRATLHACLCGEELVGVLEDACRQLGIDVASHPGDLVPDSATHAGDLVLVEVPPGDHRRLGWCRRLKAFDRGTRVALVLHQPTRARVLLACKANADAIAGVPLDAATLAAKLRGLLPA